MPRSRSRGGVAARRMFAVAVAAQEVAGLAGIGGPALAAFPGANGSIVSGAAVSHRRQVFTIRPGGTACGSSCMGASNRRGAPP
jgi:hypothetical protein